MSRGTMWRLCVTVLWGSFCAGCFSYAPTREKMPRRVEQPVKSPTWPKVDPAALEPIRAATPEEIYYIHLLPGKTLEDVKREDTKKLVAEPLFQVVRNEVIEGELIRMYKKRGDGWLDLIFRGFVPNGMALSPVDVRANSWKLVRWRAAREREKEKASWASDGVDRDSVEDEIGLRDGIPFRIPDELPPKCRGIVLHLWALAGNDYERAVAEEMKSRGWLVVDVKPLSSAVADLSDESLARIMVLEQEQDSLSEQLPQALTGEPYSQYVQRHKESPIHERLRAIRSEITELRNPAWRLCEEGDVGPTAAAIAQRIDKGMAKNAAAAKAVLETTRRVYPDLRNTPVVVMGFSAGAISTPTVAARLLPDVDAVVIVGGAANTLGVATRSVVSKGGIRIACDGKPSDERLLRALESEYVKDSQLDGYHTAPLLADRPVLVVDAGMDTWVPADLGDVLFERLGRPDRLHMSMGGYQLLFYFLPKRAAWIADWVGKVVDRRRSGTGDQAGVAKGELRQDITSD